MPCRSFLHTTRLTEPFQRKSFSFFNNHLWKAVFFAQISRPNSMTKSSATCRSTTSYVRASSVKSCPLKRKDIPPETPTKRSCSSVRDPLTDGPICPPLPSCEETFCNKNSQDAKNGHFGQRFENTRNSIRDSQKMADFLTSSAQKTVSNQAGTNRPFLSTSSLQNS